MFGLLWAIVVAGVFYKVFAMGRWPRLSLALYLTMGWSGVLIAQPVVERLTWWSLGLIMAEGVLYTAGTYFFAHDSRHHYHAIWHVFVLLGAMAHWTAILLIII